MWWRVVWHWPRLFPHGIRQACHRLSERLAARRRYIEAFRSGLASEGFIEGQNLTIEYRADSRPERLSELAADLVRRGVAAIATSGGPPAAFAAKRATETIPIVFASGGDPVQLGLVSSFNRPDKNLTGNLFPTCRASGEAIGAIARATARGHARCGTGQSDQCGGDRANRTECNDSRSRPRS